MTESRVGADRAADALRVATRAGCDVAAVRRIVSPYRICPVGAHVDHQGGTMLAMAIDAATELRFVASDAVDLQSRNYAGRVRFDPTGFAPEADPPTLPGWGRYVWAAFAVLRDRLPARPRGFTGIIEGKLPGAGLSSSASVLLAYLAAWAEVNGIEIEPRDRVLLSMQAENEYVGVQSGVLDPAAIVGGRRDELLVIDSKRVGWESIALGAERDSERVRLDKGESESAGAGGSELAPANFLVFFTGADRSLLETDFNRRVEECREAARYVADRAGSPSVSRLGDLDRNVLRSRLAAIPGALGRRARHFVEEQDRVAQARQAWGAGDLATFGAIMSDSCRSSIENYETGSDELIALQSIWTSTPGVLGARFSGAGFGGCSLALVEPGQVESVAESVLHRFGEAFPERADRARVVDVRSADGLEIR